MTSSNIIEQYNSSKADRILTMLATGSSCREIMRREKCSYYTIVNLRQRNPVKYEKWRSVAAHKTQVIAETLQDHILEQLGMESKISGTSLRDLMISYGIADDHAARLNDNPIAVVEHRKGISIEEAKRAIEEARKRVREEAVST